jgi:hypothetical protein
MMILVGTSCSMVLQRRTQVSLCTQVSGQWWGIVGLRCRVLHHTNSEKTLTLIFVDLKVSNVSIRL